MKVFKSKKVRNLITIMFCSLFSVATFGGDSSCYELLEEGKLLCFKPVAGEHLQPRVNASLHQKDNMFMLKDLGEFGIMAYSKNAAKNTNFLTVIPRGIHEDLSYYNWNPISFDGELNAKTGEESGSVIISQDRYDYKSHVDRLFKMKRVVSK